MRQLYSFYSDAFWIALKSILEHKLRAFLTLIGIIIGVWAYEGNLDRLIVKFRSAGANYVTTTLFAAQSHIRSMTETAPQLPTVSHAGGGESHRGRTRPPMKCSPGSASNVR